MPELDPLPRRPRPPSFAPRPGDYASVVGRAKRRRRRHVSGAGAGLAGVLVVVALATSTGGGTSGLHPVQPVTSPTGSAEASPGPGESPPPDAAPPSGEPQGDPHGDPPEGTGTERPTEEPGAEPTIDPGPLDPDPRDPHRPAATRPVFVRDEVAVDVAKPCDTDPSTVTPSGWCLRYEGPSVVRSGDVHAYRLLACRHVGRGTGTLTFGTEQQIDFRVSGNSRVEWTWAKGYPFPKRETTVRVPENRCARWTVQWDTVGDDGDLLRPGSYSFSPGFADVDYGGGLAQGVGMAFSLEIVE